MAQLLKLTSKLSSGENRTFFKQISINTLLSKYRHKDNFTIGDRFFRWEFPEGSPYHLKKTAEEGAVNETKPDVDGEKILSPLAKAPVSAEIPISKRLAELEAEATPSKRKRVSFGQYISPELFDKDLPPDTPVRKGAVPPSELKGM